MELQIRKMRAELNKSLQSRRSAKDIQTDGTAFEAKYGQSIWGCISQPGETFSDLYNAHLQREQENAEWRQDIQDKTDNIISLIESCGMPDWFNLKAFVERRPELLDRQDVLDCLEERRVYLEIPEEE